MQKWILIISILPLSILLLSTTTSAQEGIFKEKVDSIVNDIMQKFDNELGTYIFREEPETDEPVTSETYQKPLYSKTYGRKLTPLESHHSITRNYFPVFPWETGSENLIFRYNRVEGLFLGLEYPQKYYWNEQRISLFASGGYGFASHRWRGGIGGSHQFGFNNKLLEFGIEGHSLTDSRDQWIIGAGENTLAAFFLRDDYRDYYEREGFSIWTGLYKKWKLSDMQFQIAFLNDQYGSLSKNANWSVFGTHKTFRENPFVDEGKSKSILATFKFHSTNSRRIFMTGWSISASAEVAGRALGGIFDFNSYHFDIRRYQGLNRYSNFNIRLRAASATGDAPYQKIFELGGFGTIPAFSFKEFSGNRMLLANAEYILNGRLLEDVEFFPSWLLGNLNIILFTDAGYVTSVNTEAPFLKGFEDLSYSSIHSDWGVALGSRDGKLRLGFAWRTDKSEPVKIFLRINRPF